MDEPILVLDLPDTWQQAFQTSYAALQNKAPKLLLTTYFGGLEDNTSLACQLPVAALHIDAVRAPEQVSAVMKQLRSDCLLSVGIVDGRNIWKTDFNKALNLLRPLQQRLQDRSWIGGSCSFLHCPVDLDTETQLDSELKSWLAFARQKTGELVTLVQILNDQAPASILADNKQAIESRTNSTRIHNPAVKQRCADIPKLTEKRAPYPQRKRLQQARLHLPLLPTTTIGSFPQTATIRNWRLELKKGRMSIDEYEANLREEIRGVIAKQEELGLDVLVHGEPERNDMVEYFAEQLQGLAFTRHGWVQSYGSRCVKPPCKWRWSYAMKSRRLSKPALLSSRLMNPLFAKDYPCGAHWDQYLNEAVACFKLSTGCAADNTQIHTHMCYSEFNDIIEAIAALDADVISIETSRSNMALLDAFKHFTYPNDIGPGVYDIHSPRIPTVAEIRELIDKAAAFIPLEQLWINPDCGLKTRRWPEVEAALANMVEAARLLRKQRS